jgi:hypothetical protein
MNMAWELIEVDRGKRIGDWRRRIGDWIRVEIRVEKE